MRGAQHQPCVQGGIVMVTLWQNKWLCFLQATSTAITMWPLIKLAARAVGTGLGQWSPALGAPPSTSGCRQAAAGAVDRGSVCPDTCCFWGKVRAGPARVRMRGCPECVPVDYVCK